MPGWLNNETVAAVAAIWSTIVGPGLVLWLGRYFARRSTVHGVSQALEKYVKAHGEEHADLDRRLAAGEARFARMEEALANLPRREDILALKVDMANLSGDIRVVSAVLHRVEGPVKAITEGALAEVVK